jgi:hypothetical protein
METWKPILGFESLYEVSDFGNVRRIARGKTLDPNKVAEAKEMLAAGATLKVVAEFLNTSIATAWNIKTEKTWRGNTAYRHLKPQLGTDFYLRAFLCKESKYTKKAIHRAVWEAFNGPIPGRLEVNHKNLDRADNRLENLELLTHQENVQHAHNIYNEQRKHLPPGKRQGPRSKYATM